eukprot:15476989-Alexandrium_andersonii.AAC.1
MSAPGRSQGRRRGGSLPRRSGRSGRGRDPGSRRAPPVTVGAHRRADVPVAAIEAAAAATTTTNGPGVRAVTRGPTVTPTTAASARSTAGARTTPPRRRRRERRRT